MNAGLFLAQLPVLIAHQGGWDEIAMVLGPLVLFGGLLKLANKRAKQAQTAANDKPDLD